MAGVRSTGSLTIPQLQARIAKLRSAEFREDLSKVLGATALKLVADEFRAAVDPYGKPWAPLTSRKGEILKKTNRMQKSFTSVPLANGAGFRVDATASYAKFHQYGTRPHQRAARVAKFRERKNGMLRFVRKSDDGFLIRLRAHTNGGIPQRQMVPMTETGGLPALWARQFNDETRKLIDRRARGT